SSETSAVTVLRSIGTLHCIKASRTATQHGVRGVAMNSTTAGDSFCVPPAQVFPPAALAGPPGGGYDFPMGRTGTTTRLAAIMTLMLAAAVAHAQTAPAAPPAPQGPAAAGECARADFEAVVDDAAAALRDLNQKNKPDFQEKLR